MPDQLSEHQDRHLKATAVRRVRHVFRRAAALDNNNPFLSTVQRLAREDGLEIHINIEEDSDG